MADVSVPLNDAAAVQLWSYRTWQQAIRQCTAAKLMAVGLSADDPNNFVQLFDEMGKGAGDKVTWPLITDIVGPGVAGDGIISGQEAKFGYLTDSFVINQLRQATKPKGRMSQQRVPWSMRDAGKTALANWWKRMINISLMNQLCGNSNISTNQSVNYTGMQAAVAPDANHWVMPSTITAEASLTSSHPFSVALIPKIVQIAHSGLRFPIRPLVIKGMEINGILFLHPLQVKAMKLNFSTGEWGDIHKAALQGGQITGNPIFTGAIGMIDNVVIHEDAYCPYGDDTQNVVYDPGSSMNIPAPTSLGAVATGTTDVARGVFVGAQAAALGFGNAEGEGAKPLRVRWYEELLDAGNELRITSGMIWGIKKARFNSEDYATITVSTYAK